VGPGPGFDDMKKRKFLILPGLELRLLGRTALSQSLYREKRNTCKVFVENSERNREFRGFGSGILSFKIIKKFLEMLTVETGVSEKSILTSF
jgi:hypothetical protein